MRAARLHAHHEPLVLEDVPMPAVGPDEVLVRVTAAGMCRTDVQLVDGSFRRDAAIDCAGAEATIRLGFALLAIGGHFVSVGLGGDRIDLPLFPLVARERTDHGSFRGNHADLDEVLARARRGLLRHTVDAIRLDDVNVTLERLRAGDVVGRAVIRL